MVSYTQILTSNNNHFSSLPPSTHPLTAVFVGATAGIGLGTLQAFAKHTSGSSPTIYIVGRSQNKLSPLLSSISSLNPSAKLIPIIAEDLTKIRDAQRAAEKIKEKAEKVDLLIMSPGFISWNFEDNGEDLDRCQTIRYYSRMAFLYTLAPLLRASPSPRVVTVLGGATSGKLWPEDWSLKEHYDIPKAAGASGSMTNLFLEQFSQQPGNEKIGIVHLFPGIVGTKLEFNGFPWLLKVVVEWIAKPVFKLVGYTIEEAGERVLYAATSSKFPGKSGEREEGVEKGSDGVAGSGVYLLHKDSSAVPEDKVLNGLREEGLGKQVWDHTLEVFRRVEGN